MRINYQTTLFGTNVQLAPYHEKFVANYHVWMQSPFLLEMTGSEPLTIEEEYEMQQSWRDDEKKCTFIILAKEAGVEELDRMVGDVNLFLSKDDEGNLQSEIDVMIAEEKYRRKGMGIESVCLMLWYGVNHLKIQKFFAKIKKENDPSISLFQK